MGRAALCAAWEGEAPRSRDGFNGRAPLPRRLRRHGRTYRWEGADFWEGRALRGLGGRGSRRAGMVRRIDCGWEGASRNLPLP